jgi:hypothetical protein
MPKMDGIQFRVEVRECFGPIPFILFTDREGKMLLSWRSTVVQTFIFQKGGEPEAQLAELTHKVKAAAPSKRADDTVRKSEKKYRHVIEHSNEAIVVAQDGMLEACQSPDDRFYWLFGT